VTPRDTCIFARKVLLTQPGHRTWAVSFATVALRSAGGQCGQHQRNFPALILVVASLRRSTESKPQTSSVSPFIYRHRLLPQPQAPMGGTASAQLRFCRRRQPLRRNDKSLRLHSELVRAELFDRHHLAPFHHRSSRGSPYDENALFASGRTQSASSLCATFRSGGIARLCSYTPNCAYTFVILTPPLSVANALRHALPRHYRPSPHLSLVAFSPPVTTTFGRFTRRDIRVKAAAINETSLIS
jgi:hypothetical protein